MIVLLHYLFQILLQLSDDLLFKPRDIGLRYPQQICHLLLGMLFVTIESETQLHDHRFSGIEPIDRLHQLIDLHLLFDVSTDGIAVRPEDITEQQLVAVPVG